MSKPNLPGPDPRQQLQMLRTMKLIRAMEERLSKDSLQGALPGTVHLYIGQEAVAAGVCSQLTDEDKITSTHRGHGHFLAKGGSPEAMMAEIRGKDTGVCRGMGGSMHVADVSKGMLGANGIVGGGFAIATGAGWAARLEGRGGVSVCFFGDGASNEGVFMETLNIAAVWKLPVIFVCENNGYGEFTPSRTVTAGRIIDRARAFGIPCHEVDGNDADAVWSTASIAIERARAGEGPSFIEAATYRIHGHFEAEATMLKTPYRPAEEIEAWRGRDPIRLYAGRLVASGVASAADIAKLDREMEEIVENAVQAAEAAPPPDNDLAKSLMFTNRVVEVL